MRATQWIAAGILGLMSGVASAVPVKIEMEFWLFDHGIGLQTNPSDLSLGDATSNSSNELLYEQDYVTTNGTAAMSAYGRVDTHSTSTDNSFDYSAKATLEAYASVDAGLPQGWAFAEAQLLDFYAVAIVSETVIFTGSRSLYITDNPYAVGTELASGTRLEPGEYIFSFELLDYIVLEAYAGETFRSSATKTGRYKFTAVPAPATGLMLLTALGGLLAVRARDRRRKDHSHL